MSSEMAYACEVPHTEPIMAANKRIGEVARPTWLVETWWCAHLGNPGKGPTGVHFEFD